MSNYKHHSNVVNIPWVTSDDEYLEEHATTCNACYGTGMDRELDADCIECWGEGSILIASETQSEFRT